MVQRSIRIDDGVEPLVHRAPVIGGGRLGVYAAFGAAAGALTFPWLSDGLLRRVRGALVHDVAARHGVSVTPEARSILADPLAPGVARGVIAYAARFLGAKVAVRALGSFAPVGLIWPLGGAIRTYVLGHLFDRYLQVVRVERAVRIDADEARQVREAVEKALVRALTLESQPAPEPASIDDHRDPVTALVDAAFARAAGIPERLAQRLDSAFDEALRTGALAAQAST
jgi:plasmid stability protein